jgi:hypothetical protein
MEGRMPLPRREYQEYSDAARFAISRTKLSNLIRIFFIKLGIELEIMLGTMEKLHLGQKTYLRNCLRNPKLDKGANDILADKNVSSWLERMNLLLFTRSTVLPTSPSQLGSLTYTKASNEEFFQIKAFHSQPIVEETAALKKVYFRGPSKFLCFKIFASRSTFTATAQVITAMIRVKYCHSPSKFLLGSWKYFTRVMAVIT